MMNLMHVNDSGESEMPLKFLAKNLCQPESKNQKFMVGRGGISWFGPVTWGTTGPPWASSGSLLTEIVTVGSAGTCVADDFLDFILLLRKMSLSAVEGLSEALSLVTVSPAVENARSDGTLEAGIARYMWANRDNLLNLYPCSSHQAKGHFTRTGAARYSSTSSCAVSASAVVKSRTSPSTVWNIDLVEASWPGCLSSCFSCLTTTDTLLVASRLSAALDTFFWSVFILEAPMSPSSRPLYRVSKNVAMRGRVSSRLSSGSPQSLTCMRFIMPAAIFSFSWATILESISEVTRMDFRRPWMSMGTDDPVGTDSLPRISVASASGLSTGTMSSIAHQNWSLISRLALSRGLVILSSHNTAYTGMCNKMRRSTISKELFHLVGVAWISLRGTATPSARCLALRASVANTEWLKCATSVLAAARLRLTRSILRPSSMHNCRVLAKQLACGHLFSSAASRILAALSVTMHVTVAPYSSTAMADNSDAILGAVWGSVMRRVASTWFFHFPVLVCEVPCDGDVALMGCARP